MIVDGTSAGAVPARQLWSHSPWHAAALIAVSSCTAQRQGIAQKLGMPRDTLRT